MFEFAESPFNIPIEFSDVSSRTWRQIAAPGAWWTAEQRVGIAGAARAARNGDPADAGGLPDAVIAVAEMVGGAPAHTSRVWVEEVVESIGELPDIEAVSIASRVVAIDTFARLISSPIEPLPKPVPGDPTYETADQPPRRSRAWVAMVGFPTPPNSFSAVPAEAEAMVDITDAFYMPEFDMQYPDQERMGLHRTQIETVAGTTSHGNECFF